ncbi:hypothetical protein FACS1894152_0560 [Bacilli bacterium]|nr:hypothetical protein FACS1894152_0560 [Bacilli bacterium]
MNVKHQPYVMYKYLIANNISNPSSNKINQIVNFIKHGSGKLRVANMLGITKVNKYVKIVTL